ncbi:MAG: hypothetical protein JWP05_311 [Microbacteriaceae bacterium]|nr:hypothetical protein [Microbacteriaceae bacterium]
MAAGVTAAHSSPLADAAEELYALPLAEFTAARNDRDKRARAEGDPELARQIRLMTKPSAVAWAVNLLVRDPDAELDQFLSLGESLRAAQDNLDRDSIRDLAAQRRTLVSTLARRALGIADRIGHPLSAAATREIEQTLESALADSAAAAAVTSGRLVRALSSVGFDPVDLSDAVAAPDLPPVAGRWEARHSRSGEHPESRDGTARNGTARHGTATAPAKTPKREVEKARREVEDAEGRAEDAAAELDALSRRIDVLARKRETLTAELDALKSTASGLEAELRVLDREASGLGRQRTESSRAAAQAKRAVARAADRLDELT